MTAVHPKADMDLSADFVAVWPRLLKNSSRGSGHEISCPLSAVAHHGHEGTGESGQIPILTARRAVEMASSATPPLQNQIGRFLPSPHNRVFQQPRPLADLGVTLANACFGHYAGRRYKQKAGAFDA